MYAGDSTVRKVFWATAKKLDAKGAGEAQSSAEKHKDLTFDRAGVTLKFIWDPFLNTSVLHQYLATQRNAQSLREQHGDAGTKSSAITLVGGGLWHAQHFGNDSLKHFKDSVNTITWLTSHGEHGVSSQQIRSSFPNRPKADALVVYAPVQIPWYSSLSPPRAAKMTAASINPMNEYLQKLSMERGLLIAWSHFFMTLQRKSAYEENGLHVVDTVARQKADVLLNLRCNTELTQKTKYPVDKTCCSKYPQTNWIQMTFLFGSLWILPFTVWVTSGGM